MCRKDIDCLQFICRTVAGIAFLALLLMTAGCGEKKGLEQTAVYSSGTDGYHTCRIPALIVTSEGTLLAFCEGRAGGRGDAGDIDIVLKRSKDNGRTWSGQQVVWDDGTNTCGNPCPVVDEQTGVIWLLMTWNLGSDHEREIIRKESGDTRKVFVCSSHDDGVSWKEPAEITRTAKDPAWGWYATGPGHAIQMKKGIHKGRLVIPCDHSYDDPGGKVGDGPYEYGSHIIYSDDHGATWRLGGVIRPGVNECQVVELADGKGTLLINMRSYSGRHRRTQSLSRDGGMTWSEPADVAHLIEPVCQASIIRYSDIESGGGDRILFSNPASEKREKMTVKMSRDHGETWTVERLLHPGPSAYSDLAVTLDGKICCLYERGVDQPYETITLARFDLEWLEGD